MLCLQLKSKWPDFAGRCWRYRGAGPSPSTTNSKPANSKRGFSELSNGRDGINAEGFVVPDGFDKARSLAAFKDIIPSCTPRCLVRHGRHPCCTARRKRSTSGLWSHPRRRAHPGPAARCRLRSATARLQLMRRYGVGNRSSWRLKEHAIDGVHLFEQCGSCVNRRQRLVHRGY
jgi:hypothetical protein